MSDTLIPLPDHYKVVQTVDLATRTLALSYLDLNHDDPLLSEVVDVFSGIDIPYEKRSRLRRGGVYAAHALRLRFCLDRGDGTDETAEWADLLAGVHLERDSRSRRRLDQSLEMRRAALRDQHTESRDVGEDVARWLPTSGADYVAHSAKLARRIAVLPHPERDELLRLAWFSVHGLPLLDALRAHAENFTTAAGGRPTQDTDVVRRLQMLTAYAVHDAQITTKSEIAQRAGVTRVTLNAWLAKR